MQTFLSESNGPSPLLSKRLVLRVPTRERQSENIRRVNEVFQIAHTGDLARRPRKVRLPPLLVPKTPTKQVIPGWSAIRKLRSPSSNCRGRDDDRPPRRSVRARTKR